MRKIIHLDLDAFFCAVEEQFNSALIGKPFAVGGRPEQRGVISSCSYAARRFGIHSAMPMAQAVRMCPELIIVPPRHKKYLQSSRLVMAKLREVTSLIEQISIDEAFCDVSDLVERGKDIAEGLQHSINQEIGLPCSIGVASNKLVAKIANDVGKAASKSVGPPNAITIVLPGQEAAFLAPLPTRALWGVGPKTAERLSEYNMHTIGDIALCPERELVKLFGKIGSDLSRRSKGIDNRPVVTYHEPKSISQEITFVKDIKNGEQLRKTLLKLSKKVGERLRQAGYSGTTVRLKLRWADFTTITRQKSFDSPIDEDKRIFEAVLNLFNTAWQDGKFVRLLGVGVSGFRSPIRQLSLWDVENYQDENIDIQLQQVLQKLRDRYGNGIILKASEIDLSE